MQSNFDMMAERKTVDVSGIKPLVVTQPLGESTRTSVENIGAKARIAQRAEKPRPLRRGQKAHFFRNVSVSV